MTNEPIKTKAIDKSLIIKVTTKCSKCENIIELYIAEEQESPILHKCKICNDLTNHIITYR